MPDRHRCGATRLRLLFVGAGAALVLLALLAVWVRPAAAVSAPEATSAAAESADPLVVRLESDAWPPFNDLPAANGGPEGYAVDVARSVFAHSGRTVRYRLTPWKRSVQLALSGEIDGVIGASATDGKGLVFPALEIARTQPVMAVRAGDPWRFDGLASLAGRRLGAAVGYDYGVELNGYIETHRDDPALVQLIADDTPLAQNLRKLLAGRIDATVDNEIALRWTARSLGLGGQIAYAGSVAPQKSLFLAFAPTDRGRALAAEWDAGLATCRASGGLARILASYGLTDWQSGDADAAR